MPRTARQLSNIPPTPRWSYETAAREFNVNTTTLKKRLSTAGIECGKDQCYATSDIVNALFGNLHAARIRKTNEEADNVALRNSIVRRDWHPAAECEKILSEVFTVMRQEIIASSVPIHTRDSLLSHLRQLGEVDWSKL